MNENVSTETGVKTKQKRAFFALRAVIAFVLLVVLLAVLYWWGFHSYRDVAEWVTPGDHSAFVYQDETYYLSGVIGKRGLTLKKYPIEKIVGQVKDDGTPVITDSATLAETDSAEELDPLDTEFLEELETFPESVVPPVGAELFSDKGHAYILYSVEDQDGFLLLLEEDGEYYLYYREGVKDPLSPVSDDE
ncbi:MAG: hypothetical protein IJA91_03875 [Clostridia bacterium]|nr:hypothetical protein [Clostridia bacterium]